MLCYVVGVRMYATVLYGPHLGIVLQFQEYFEAAENIKGSVHIIYMQKGGVS